MYRQARAGCYQTLKILKNRQTNERDISDQSWRLDEKKKSEHFLNNSKIIRLETEDPNKQRAIFFNRNGVEFVL